MSETSALLNAALAIANTASPHDTLVHDAHVHAAPAVALHITAVNVPVALARSWPWVVYSAEGITVRLRCAFADGAQEAFATVPLTAVTSLALLPDERPHTMQVRSAAEWP